MDVSVILLAGGKGKRMQSASPKQFLPLKEKAVALHSLEVLQQLKEVKEIIVVCAPEWRHIFHDLPVHFALPGQERQDSVYNGFLATNPSTDWVCIHDSARPFITAPMIQDLFHKVGTLKAASLAMPVKNTIKQTTTADRVAATLDRSLIWEIQTPQLIKREVLKAGFNFAKENGLSVTDDVSLAELIGETVQLVRGNYSNLKITTPEDLAFAEWICSSQNRGEHAKI